jgi:hypothetical protein
MNVLRNLAGASRRAHFIVAAALLSAAVALWSASAVNASPAAAYTHALSSGTFILPPNAKSVDWEVLNDSPSAQSIRVTVYKVLISAPKTVVVSATTATIQPNAAYHDANSVSSTGVFRLGATYEVVVELNDLHVLPVVDVWSQHFAELIPGTHIAPPQFSQIR